MRELERARCRWGEDDLAGGTTGQLFQNVSRQLLLQLFNQILPQRSGGNEDQDDLVDQRLIELSELVDTRQEEEGEHNDHERCPDGGEVG